jgi:hypothetical protein
MVRTAAANDRPLPDFGPEAMIAAQSRYLEAWADAGQIMADAMRTVVQRQTEIAGAGLREFWSAREQMLRSEPGERAPADQLDRLRESYERAFAHFQELSGIMIKAQAEAMNVLGSCAVASVEEVRKAAA